MVHTQKWVHDKWTGYVYLRNVHAGKRSNCAAEIERMKLEQARLDEDAKMARRIQTLLAFKEQYRREHGRGAGDRHQRQRAVARCCTSIRVLMTALKPDMAVITPTGIVGKIVQVSPGSSQVLPINDQLSGVGAALKDSRLQGILKGAANGTTTLQYIMSDEPVKPGEPVITSGGDRIFPKGLAGGHGGFGRAGERPVPEYSRDSVGATGSAGGSAGHHQDSGEAAGHEGSGTDSRV